MHLALLIGGLSAERPISLKSAEGLKAFLAETNHTYDVYDVPSEIDTFLANYKKYDIVIPYIHGRYGEDGVLTGMCETLGLQYIGCPAITHALCINKFWTNCVVEKLGLAKVPKSWIPGMTSPRLLGLPETTLTNTAAEEQLPMSLIVKPNSGGSTVATNKATSFETLLSGLEEVNISVSSLNQQNREKLIADHSQDTPVFERHFYDAKDVPIVQECIEGEEYTVGLVGSTENPEVLPIMQIVNIKSALFDWQEKYESDGSNEIFPENMDPQLQNELVETSKKIFTALGCRGVARIDYRVRDGVPYFLEVNTFPGATTASFIPKMWQKSGRKMGDFIEMLIRNSAE